MGMPDDDLPQSELKMGNLTSFIARAKDIREGALELFDQRALKAAATGRDIPWNTYVAEAVDAAIAGTLAVVSKCGVEAIVKVEGEPNGKADGPHVNITFSDELSRLYFEEVNS